MTVKILLADDHPLICKGFHQVVSEVDDFHLIDTLENGEDLIHSYIYHNPDVIIVDISMPKLDGIEAFKQIKQKDRNVKCLFYSFCGSKFEIFNLYEIGAKGYICKSSEGNLIVTAIRSVVNDQIFFDKSFSEKDYRKLKNADNLLGKKLTKRESGILVLVAQGHSNKIIANKLSIAERTVEFHRRNIRLKFGLVGSTELVKFALEKIK